MSDSTIIQAVSRL